MITDFFIYVDKEGKMPVMTPNGPTEVLGAFLNHHPYWIQYKNNRPVKTNAPKEVITRNVSGDGVWDYSVHDFVPYETMEVVQ